jgi:hypothetical protein
LVPFENTGKPVSSKQVQIKYGGRLEMIKLTPEEARAKFGKFFY